MKTRNALNPCAVAFLAARLVLAVLFSGLLSCEKSKSTGSAPDTKEARVSDPKSAIPDGPRLFVPKGTEVFTDRAALVEVLDAEEKLKGKGDEERLRVFQPLRTRQLGEGRRVDLSRDRIVRLIKNASTAEGYCEVFAENAPKNQSPTLWVQKSFLRDETDLQASRMLTGNWIFRGNEGMQIEGEFIAKLQDVIAAVYEGTITEETASKCLFMPEAQGGEIESEIGDFVIYREQHPTAQRLIQFAMRRSGKNSLLFSAPVRFIGRQQFTTKNGTVRMIPVVELQTKAN